MRVKAALLAGICASVVTFPAHAQNASPNTTGTEDSNNPVIVVTAQRQAQSLQEVPIAVSAFSAEALEAQQIDNSSDLQLTLPNVTFTKGNFTGSSFTIRGIGDLCVGTTCDAATGIHVNDQPVLGTRLFETEFFDLERIEVLRGPQGTLYGRNATSGVINFITAKPDLTGFHAALEGDYGNYDSIKAKGMINIPIGETLGIRLAGTYLNRDGYTLNTYNGNRVDDRDLYAIRGSLRWEPTANTTVDLIGYYFHERDNRARIQKQLCHRDPTGVLGCLPDKLAYETTNGNSTLGGAITSREALSIILGSPAAGAAYGLGSVYDPDGYTLAGSVNPADKRKVYTDFDPTYYTTEEQYSARVEQGIGPLTATLSGIYKKSTVDSQQDYNLAVSQINRAALGAAAATLPNVAAALFPSGPAGPLCTSQSDPNGIGAFGGNSVCATTALDFDRSVAKDRQYAGEFIIDSSYSGMFNFLLGASYVDVKASNVDYYVDAFPLDYFAGVVGGLSSGGAAFLGTPFYRNNTRDFRLKSYGIFGETYFEFNDRLKLTLGLRYNHDSKDVTARTTLWFDSGNPIVVTNAQGTSGPAGTAVTPAVVPYGATDFTQALTYALLDFDSTRPGIQEYTVNHVSFGRLTGRAVIDYQLTPDNLLYASYSRGYKSGGINPPLSPLFAVPTSFGPESVNAFEIGSKNTFSNAFQLNLTAFYYDYKALQLSRIVARTSVNDNVDATIYGLEAEAVIRPVPEMVINLGASYLHTEVTSDKLLSNPRDPSGGRADAVIIKDITNGSNCAVVPVQAGNAAGTNAFVGAINAALGLRAPAAFPANSGLAATGAFSVCSALASSVIAPSAPLAGFFGVQADGTLPYQVLAAGVPVNIKGNKLPQAPNFKWSAGAQYTFETSNGWSIVPRFDLTYTGDSSGNIFNGFINKIPGYAQANAQIQLNGAEDRWFARAYIQNIFDSNATTGLYVTDQSSGNFTNIFTLEPRRYGIAAGVNF
jgi:outer membrane receptor protein involved in Fe transport